MGEIIKELFANISRKRDIRARFGGAEFEFKIVEKLQKGIKQVAHEPDSEKRLELAKKILSVNNVLKDLNKTDLKYLEKYNREANAFISFPYLIDGMANEEREAYSKLSQLGLITGYPSGGGESIDYITPLGKDVLHRLEN